MKGFRAQILKVLSGGEYSGMELLSRLQATRKRGPTLASFYVTLFVMEKQGLVASRWGEERPPERGYRPRRYYALTVLGTETMQGLERQGAS